MNYQNHVYIASCVFTQRYPELSARIQHYLKNRFNMNMARCCTRGYKTAETEAKIPDWYLSEWKAIPAFRDLRPGDTMVSICGTCMAIFAETHPEIKRKSLWELVLEDREFEYPNFNGYVVTVQDCWRFKDNPGVRHAVRLLLHKMGIDVQEMPDPKPDFCGTYLLEPAPLRNRLQAPKHFVAQAAGKFLPHTPEEQRLEMRKYCRRFGTDMIVAYCHSCTRGLKLGGANAWHLAQLLFDPGGVV